MAKVNLGRVVGRSAYEEAVRLGYKGTELEWLQTLEGDNAYQIAKQHGFEGTEYDWLQSLNGKTAYESAKSGGFAGTEDEFNTSIASIGYINEVLDQINGEVV